MLRPPNVIPLPVDQGLSSVIRVMVSEARGPGFKYQPREIRPTLYFVLGLPDVIPLPVDQGLSSRGPGFKGGSSYSLLCVTTSKCNSVPVDQGLYLAPEVQGSNTRPGRFSLLFTLCIVPEPH